MAIYTITLLFLAIDIINLYNILLLLLFYFILFYIVDKLLIKFFGSTSYLVTSTKSRLTTGITVFRSLTTVTILTTAESFLTSTISLTTLTTNSRG